MDSLSPIRMVLTFLVVLKQPRHWVESSPFVSLRRRSGLYRVSVNQLGSYIWNFLVNLEVFCACQLREENFLEKVFLFSLSSLKELTVSSCVVYIVFVPGITIVGSTWLFSERLAVVGGKGC
jgi:hypothetical protein